MQKGGRVQPESKSFEIVLFTPSLTFFWTLNGGRGSKYLNFGPLKKLPPGSTKWADKKVTSRVSKMRGEGKATFGQCTKEKLR